MKYKFICSSSLFLIFIPSDKKTSLEIGSSGFPVNLGNGNWGDPVEMMLWIFFMTIAPL